MQSRENIYLERKKSNEERILDINKQTNLYSILRVIIFVSAIITTYFVYKKTTFTYAILILLAHIALFIYTVKLYEKTEDKKKKLEKVIKINLEHIKRLNGEWKKFDDKGEEYLDGEHGFTNDLDIFGKSSLFQWINVTGTSFGRKKLKEILRINELPNKQEIILRQETLRELGEKIDFREKLQVETMDIEESDDEIAAFKKWCKDRNNRIISLPTKIIRLVCPIINIAVIVAVILGVFRWEFLILLLAGDYLILRTLTKETVEVLKLFSVIKKNLQAYFKIIELIENEDFNAETLSNLKAATIINGEKSSKKFKQLADCAIWIYDRGNGFYFLLNALLMFDFQILYKLEMWRIENGDYVDGWFETIGDIEAISSLSLLSYNNPNWCIPNIEDGLIIKGDEVAHPTLMDKAVSNSFVLDKGKSIMLITGSNMSGKSTFLRTLGFNLILTYLGSPVRAKSFNAGIFNVYTCMRTGDNLEESISSFYAEILRVKNIVEASKRDEKIFFLLDEIFKGTNSLDRHTGATILINQLSTEKAMGLVSTHDLELCDLETTNKKVVNYNFREYYENNQLRFDYKLRYGKSETKNAIYLMKMAGIEIK
ncbi:MutS domain V [Clostridium cavendishii DSM 21758]|uniref:MutS domain V n=1 Tax=Clostridium cavendishii DSM 21758 TaxID=1121302 RepID=A0A1M6VLQ6_9CLOT|nr:DNA mismatch repair protein MutS [Clostridium cavendishii]SHK82176.1 MutS domain V [Clostridium cavendishii DSM 21758]